MPLIDYRSKDLYILNFEFIINLSITEHLEDYNIRCTELRIKLLARTKVQSDK